MFDWHNSTSREKIGYLGLRLQSRANALQNLENYWQGTQPSTYLPAALVTQLGNIIPQLNVNYCKKTVTALTDRLKITGFRVNGALSADPVLWQAWTRNKMPVRATWALRDALALGSGYVSVWVDAAGRPQITVESPRQMLPYIDPVTREPLGYLKQWSFFDDVSNAGTSWSVLYLPDRVETWTTDSAMPPNGVPATGWRLVSTVPNPLGVLPIVQLLNADNVLDFYGTSEFHDVMSLQDALNKSLLDLIAASDAAGQPRKFISGLNIQLDDAGNPIDPFSQEKSRVWVSESAESKMFQFDGAALTNFVAESQHIIRQIGAVSDLPEYLLGVGVTNPTSADAIRAANLSLTTKAQGKTDLFGPAFGRVAQLVLALETGRAVDDIEVSPIWGQIEDRSQAMTSDSVSKLVAAGVPLALALEIQAGWTSEQVEQLLAAQKTQAQIGSNAA